MVEQVGSIRDKLLERENRILSEWGFKSADSKGRKIPEEPDSVRTDFQRDRDRIIHSKAFRRLKHKTQVFLSPVGDHFRTRMTHTLEVTQIARTIGRALGLNEDLIEAIGLGHDLGHTPFGHEGEKVMDEWCGERGMKDGFQHHIQSVRVVEVLEREGQGLNLTHEVVEGILKHTKGKSDYTLDVGSVESLHWEGRVVKISDRIAYVNHDLQDAIYSGLISDSDIPSKFIDFLGTRNSLRIGSMVNNIIFTTLENGVLSMTPEMQEMVNELKDWMFDRVYFHPVVRQHDMVIKRCMVGILNTFYEDEEVSKEYMRGWEEDEGKRLRKIVDYVAGMTDRYAVKVAQELMLPSPWPL